MVHHNQSRPKRYARNFVSPRWLGKWGLVCFVAGFVAVLTSGGSDNSAGAVWLAIFWGLWFYAWAAALLILIYRFLRTRLSDKQPAEVPASAAAKVPAAKFRLTKKRLVIGGLVIAALIAYFPINDALTISNADPAMVKLAQAAGMSRKGELLFLRTHPQLEKDSQLTTDCQSAAINSTGYLEQGCYDPNTGRIYIRDMPADLHDMEVVTAAYEMLHPVYESLESNDPQLDKAIEAEYSTRTDDKQLTALVNSFAKSEPGARDEELFSILGTQYSDISGQLADYYAPYFTSLSGVISANNSVQQLFADDQTQLKQIKAEINHDFSLADTAYADSVDWAYEGNAYEDSYNYNIYLQDLAAGNNAVNRYNNLLEDYNKLVTEYNGQQTVAPLSTVHTNASR